MFVSLKIPDTTAITTFHTLEKLGFTELKKLKREIAYSFEINGDTAKFREKAGKVDILVNANKNNVRYGTDDDAIHVLVKDADGADSLLSTLKDRLGLKEINSMEKGTLWSLYFDCDKEKAKKLAEEIADKLLFSQHYQEMKIIE